MKPAIKSRIWAGLSYIPPFFALFLLNGGKDYLVFFHARQALWIWLLFVAAAVMILLPGQSQFFTLVKWPPAIGLILLFGVLLVTGLSNALTGKTKALPPLGDYVEQKGVFQSLRKH